jgi:hypothetical protein
VEISTVPADATILVDNVKLADRSPFVLEKPPGQYLVAVVRPGYSRNEQSIEVRAGQAATLSVTLEAAADTGFELTSEPPGGLVWLDGNAMSGPDGQARTDFRAYRIPPGKHVLEIKGDPKRQPWREDVDVEPGVIKKVKAFLAPVGVAEAAKPPAPASATTAPGPVVAQLPPTSGSPPAAGTPGKPPIAKPTPNPANLAAAAARRRRAVPREPRDTVDSDTPSLPPVTSRPRVSAPPTDDSSGAGGDCTITVGTRPWSEIWIDGKNTGRHTPYSESIACGKHKLTFKRPDLNLARTEAISVRPGEKFKQSFSLEESSE